MPTSTIRRARWRECAASTGGRRDQRALGRDADPDRGRPVVPALDRAVVHRQPGRGRVRGAVGAVDPRGGRLLDGRGEDAMTGLDVLLAVAGLAATALVVAGMILLTPRGTVEPSPADTPAPPARPRTAQRPDGERPVSTERALADR